MNVDSNSKKQKVIITDKSSIELNGVLGILSFDEEYVTLSTNFGNIYIDGKNLKVEELIKEQEKISISGDIIGFYYSDKKSKKGLFG